MTINDVTTLISSVGFPICMCGAMFWYMIKENEAHKVESSEMKSAINALEIAITKLTDKITSGT
nr:MAG TPA: YvrJ protein family protein [Bacteriophage sp.]